MLQKAPRLLLALVALAAVPALFGCSRQQEGERCSSSNGNSDCGDDLVCTNLGRQYGKEVYRCCPEAGETSTDARCRPVSDVDNPGDGGAGGMSGGDDDPKTLGHACDWNSDCTSPLICGPGGTCNYECKKDRDCDGDKICSSEQVCVSQ